jgi:hypothetical protein
MSAQASSEDQESRFKRLSQEGAALEKDAALVEAQLEAHKTTLRNLMDECRNDLGVDPNDLPGEIRRMEEVLRLKLDTYESDIRAGQELIAPMIAEIRR